ncbi:hypothetical protein OAF28_01005 [Akkermansiaceae bacterium]|nr:hypothetical protein [Akkermansiaceae bacterium]
MPQGKDGSISVGGWTHDNEGFVQQTFLGASVRNFDLNAGFGDTTSSLSVSVVNDEYNKSDGRAYGDGDDAYHNGLHDEFKPPVVGSPVFFKFGKHTATVEQSWRLHFDDTYNENSLAALIAAMPGPFLTNPPTLFPKVTTNGPINTIPNGHYLISKTGTGTSQVNLWEDQSALFNDLNHPLRGSGHFVFGGILQSYTENRGPQGNPLYNISVQDPREILSNATLVLNNYAGTTYNNKNLFNVYGFLEYSRSRDLTDIMETLAVEKVVLTKYVKKEDIAGNPISPPKIYYRGKDLISGNVDTGEPAIYPNESDFYKFPKPRAFYQPSQGFNLGSVQERFPITGPGFSRRSEQGIPIYRVVQAVNTLFEYKGALPEEYRDAGFGGEIDFRGYNYVVDFSGIPFDKIPALYYLDFDQIDILSFVQELCEIISHDFFVSLLPVIDHPACSNLYKRNQYYISQGEYNKIITGIIRIDTIDKSKQPTYGAIKSYIDNLSSRDIHVENRDLGFEVSNVTTDKFLVGSQEVDMYYFNTEKDRDILQKALSENGQDHSFVELQSDQWKLETSLQQQVLPFYGFIGDECPTIPLGFGSYQQIKLDSSNLDAYGVGRYYVATEMELRAASISYEQWRDFLLLYDEAYIQELGENQAFRVGAGGHTGNTIEGLNDPEVGNFPDIKDLQGREFGVAVPRCVHMSDLNGIKRLHNSTVPHDIIGEYPLSPCAPPFGFPLYYKRAESIGIPQAGLAEIQNSITRCITNIEKIDISVDANRTFLRLNIAEIELSIQRLSDKVSKMQDSDAKRKEEEKLRKIKVDLANRQNFIHNQGPAAVGKAAIKDALDGSKDLIKMMPRLARQYEKNAKKVYKFVKDVADKHLGRTFLVRVPKLCNVNYKDVPVVTPKTSKQLHYEGPYGFKPRTTTSGISYSLDSRMSDIRNNGESLNTADPNHFINGPFHHYLNDGNVWIGPDFVAISGSDDYSYSDGALKCSYNPISERWDFNYKPEPQGGFFDEEKFKNTNLDLHKEQEKSNAARAIIPFWGNFIDKNGRISCYVKYDNSQYLEFDGVSSNDIIQHDIQGNIHFPDIMEDIDNVNPDAKESFDKIGKAVRKQVDGSQDTDKNIQHVAYLKCDIDEKFYMIPKTKDVDLCIWADSFRYKLNFRSLSTVEEIDPDTGCVTEVPARPYAFAIFNPVSEMSCGHATIKTFDFTEEVFTAPTIEQKTPSPENTERDTNVGVSSSSSGPSAFPQLPGYETEVIPDSCLFGNGVDVKRTIVKTKREDLDPDHIYSLVTLPTRVIPSVDQRYVDGPMMQFNAPQIRNALTADVTRYKPFINCPHPVINKGDGIKCEDLTFKSITSALRAQKSIYQKVSLALPEGALSFVSPSPVYPDLFALPLMSMERCYGPWLSSFDREQNPNFTSLGNYQNIDPQTGLPKKRYSNLGGKIEFEKDESLAPWNYAGYDLMHEAGELKSAFSNSLLLFNERGGFVIPEAPTGISLGKALVNEGPLVTSISVSVSNSIKTTVKMDVYTARFGKLQKQKEISIGKIVRETQRIKDEKNRAIRLGLRDEAISRKSMTEYNAQGATLGNAARVSNEALSSLEKKQTSYDNFVGSASRESEEVAGFEFDANGSIVKKTAIRWGKEDQSWQAGTQIADAMGAMDDKWEVNTLASYGGVKFVGHDPLSFTYMASTPPRNPEAIWQDRIGTDYDKLKDV